jgi:acyl-CoA synthetase (AMP-forming)/AMP-acid ligase II
MMETVRACIEQHADATPDRPFLIAPEINKTLSFAELKNAVDDVGRRLDQLGVGQGSRVAFLLNNGYWTLRLFLGVMASNRIIVPWSMAVAT